MSEEDKNNLNGDDLQKSGSKKLSTYNNPDGDNESHNSGDNKGSGPIEGIRGFISDSANTVKNAVKDGVSGLKNNGFNKIKTTISGGIDNLSNFLNLPKKITATALAVCLGLSSAGVGAYWYNNHQMNILLSQEDASEDDCAEEVKAMKVGTSDVGDTSGLEEEYAFKAWSVCKAFGMSDEQAAGVLGNMQWESTFDPTTIESIYDEPFNINGPRKSRAVADMCEFFRTSMIPAYIRNGWSIKAHTTKAGCHVSAHSGSNGHRINTTSYEGSDGHFVVGIGLLGFTGASTTALMQYGEASGKGWWDFDVQMAFSIDTTGGYSRAPWVHEWVKTGHVSSPEDAAVQWNKHFEGVEFRNQEKGEAARKWYNKFKGQTGDLAYGQSVIALADSIGEGAMNISVAKAEDECATAEKSFGNNSIAEAAVAYAWETTDLGRGNDGTELYRTVHDIVFAGDGIYQSCDRGAGTAVVWSGADDSFPAGPTITQLEYLMGNTEQWQKVGMLGSDVKREDLQPGDICIIGGSGGSGHIVVFTGNEAVKAKYPNSTAEIVSASLNTRSPGCQVWTDKAMLGDSRGQYHVFRNIKPEEAPQFVDCVSGMQLDDGRGK